MQPQGRIWSPTNFYACNFQDQIGYHDFEGVTVRAEEGERLVQNLGNHSILMLRNHGPVVMDRIDPGHVCEDVGASACLRNPGRNAQSQGEANVVPQEVSMCTSAILQSWPVRAAQGVFDFEAWKRRMDKIDDSWRSLIAARCHR